MQLLIDAQGTVSITVSSWPQLRLTGLQPALRVDGDDDPWIDIRASDSTVLTGRSTQGLRLELSLQARQDTLLLRGIIHNDDSEPHDLDDVVYLGTGAADTTSPAMVSFASDASHVRILEQGNYWGHVRRLGEQPEASAANTGEHDTSQARVQGSSDHVAVVYDPNAGMALLSGFQTSERWLGRIQLTTDPGGVVVDWRLGFDGAGVRLMPGSATALEEAVLIAGPDPWALLEAYGDRVAARHHTTVSDSTPVTWCSWYPYRLSVSEDRVLETAQIAAQRLVPLGMSTLVVDLGWQSGNLPSAFTENERFGRGLRWLADQLEELGLQLGAWCAPYSISELDPIATEHPEYLVQDEQGRPAATGTWFWEPHGKVHVLDLTHPGARQWLRDRMASLAARGVAYLKPDFIGCVSHPVARHRHDRSIAAGGATQAGRIGAQIVQQSMPQTRVLNCGGPEMPGTGAHPLLYTCNDTGNTGFISTSARRRNTQSLACHLWKNRRWGILQPSCLCVGLPGTIEEARLRATIAFLAGGQIDISDTLQSLPEDRWEILHRTLPPLGTSARPVDLFEPLLSIPFDYEKSTQGEDPGDAQLPDLPAGSVWHLPVDAGWDQWDLVGIFCMPHDTDSDSPAITRFVIPFDRFGLGEDETLTGYEFWSGQYLDKVPSTRPRPGNYSHPGDYQDLLCGETPGCLDLAFYGPSVKLLCLRRRRSHPWVAGTGFHQSCGTELSNVTWDEDRGVLRGALHRPVGESSTLTFTTAGRSVAGAHVAGQSSVIRSGAQGSLVVPLVIQAEQTQWSVQFD